MSDAVDAFLAQYFARHPVNATFTGVHAHDARLPDWSQHGRAADAVERRALRAALGGDASLDAELARANLDVRNAEFERGFMARNPALWTGEAIFGAVSLMQRPFAARNERLAPLSARLSAVEPFLATMQSALEERVPSRWIARAQQECRAAVSLFGDGLEQWLALEPVDAALAAGVRVAAAEARAAFRQCGEWLASMQYASTSDYSAGATLFGVLLRSGHLCERPVRDLLRDALAAMGPAQEQLVSLRRDAGDDPVPDPYLPAFAATWNACHDTVRARDLVTWPAWQIRYVPMPDWAEGAARDLYWLFYRSPAPFDAYTVHDYLVQPGWTASAIKLNHVVHHGALGHHVQNWHATHRSRSSIGTVAAVDGANRIGMFLGGSMAEGWACYATELMDECGFLTPAERALQQQSRVRMLARAVVDICLHTQGMTFGEAAEYYVREAGMSADVAHAEVTKNSMFPCTAIMYWLGTQGILDLRDAQKRQHGAAFTLKAFHDELLSYGSIPVSLVSRLMSQVSR